MKQLTEKCLEIIQPRPKNSHKGTFGRVVLIGGNAQYGGAIMMSAEACVRSGAGLVTVITHSKNHAPLHARLPEVMVVDWQDEDLIADVFATADVCLIGPGLGLEKRSKELLAFVLQKQDKQWFVIDGSAITLISEDNLSLPKPKQTVFTPHQMEWQRLSHIPISEQNQQLNQYVQQKLQATIVLKSHRTEIYHHTGIYQNLLGNPGMATGGTGDTLAGMITGFLAQFPKDITSIHAAVYLHSYIGDQLAKERYVVLPTEISAALPFWMNYFANA
ncbi:YjeF family domain-containing protein [Enterococcus sp. DIV2402]|uniref:ADP-dependent (S)-NAD(P)H-hydrate dehydratase n=1 Tax=Candidatus Enterococcus lowellii TaxID=2230877 RepID=A0ABZ2SL42_9ENTE|nr:NAD(P)H-hydrate dehydratase [Enterococcus sp. DIV2402]MBO0465828.1 NAD(P)H-hydrate dehydratase [Enterococcus sp. DIV2402]